MFQINMLIFKKLQCQGENNIIHPGGGGGYSLIWAI